MTWPKIPAPPPLRDVDFSEATFRDVRLPASPDVFLVRRYRCVAERGVAELDDDESLPAKMLRAQFSAALRGPGTSTEAHVFNRRDYLASGGEELADRAEELLRRLEADCLNEEVSPPSHRRRLLGRRS